MDRAKLEKIHSEIAALPLRKRLNFPGLDSKRADIIVAGSLVVLTLMRMLDLSSILVSKKGIREGLVLDLIAKNRKSLSKKKW